MTALISIVHDPDGKLVEPSRQLMDRLRNYYQEIIIGGTDESSEELQAIFWQNNVRYYQGQKTDLSTARRWTLKMYEVVDCKRFHYCDFDRILHWVAHYPDELSQAIRFLQQYDFTIFERSCRAFETHPPFQRQTEAEANALFNEHWGFPVDILAGSRGLSVPAADLILSESQSTGAGVDAEWPLILRGRPHVLFGYMVVEGLEYESNNLGIQKEKRHELKVRMDNLKDVMGLIDA